LAKLAGANAIVVIVAWMATWLTHRNEGTGYDVLVVLATALLAGLLVNAFLVGIALRPIRSIEDTAERFWKGDLAARVPWSAVADRDIERLSGALNLLLDSNEQGRIRLRALAEGVMRYEERLRVETARALSESHAQALAGLLYRISAAIAECESDDCRKDLEAARQIAQRGVEDLRDLSSRVHPRLLDDFGLIAAVCHMARTIQKEVEGMHIDVSHEEVFSMANVSRSDKAVLYRVTDEAVRSAVAHGAMNITVSIRAARDGVVVDILDDRTAAALGSDLTQTAALWLMRERLAFIGGTFVAQDEPAGGVRVSMRLPLSQTIMDGRFTPVSNQTENQTV
jgi:signal transduction histidine kinase